MSKKTKNPIVIERNQTRFNHRANRVFIVIVSVALGFIIGYLTK